VILGVSDELDAMEALFDYRGLEWEQEPFGETTLYNSHVHGSSDQHRLAWMLDGNLLLLCQTYGDDPLPALKTLAGLQRSDSLAELPVWQTLVGRLPARSLGVFFVNAAVGFGGSTPPADDSSLAGQLAYQMEGVAMAATPGEQAMRLDIVGVARPQDDASARVRNLMSQEPLDLAVWDHLPAGTALALAGRDAPLIWPLADAFGLSSNSLAALRDTLGLDVEADLVAPGGVLSGEYAFAVTPPLPEQPVSQGVAALQVLIAATGAAAQQADPLRAAMEARGAAFGPGEAEGVPLQVQAGTALSGYALAYGEHDGTLLLGTSPAVVGQGIAAARDRAGLPHTDHFWTIRAGWSLGPTLALYIDHERLAALMQSNSASGQAVGLNDALLQAFHTTGLVLRLQPDRVDGTLYFLLE
jgi:hypothetical protein